MDSLSRVPKNIELFLNGRVSLTPIIINDWIRENTPFEAITDYTQLKLFMKTRQWMYTNKWN
jgi:hypothetical protein